MLLTGVGVGFTMQVIVLATQNEVPASDLGIATSAVNFFRAIGGSVKPRRGGHQAVTSDSHFGLEQPFSLDYALGGSPPITVP